MSTETDILELALEKANYLFTIRQLDEAEAAATRILQDAEGPIVQTCLLLARIHTKRGQFVGLAGEFETAKQFLDRAQAQISSDDAPIIHVQSAIIQSEWLRQTQAYPEALKAAELALELAQSIQHLPSLIDAFAMRCQALIRQNRLDEAEATAQAALEALGSEPSEAQLAEVYYQFCQIHIKRQAYARLLDYSEQLLDISRRQNHVELEISALNNLAIYYGTLSDYKSAMQHALEVLDKSKTIGFRRSIAESQINIATIYASLLNYKEAIKRYQTALDEYDDVLDTFRKTIVNNNLGNIHYHTQQNETAIQYFRKAYEMAETINYQEMKILSLAQHSRVLVAQKQLPEALTLAREAQTLIEPLGDDVNGKQINLINLSNIHFLQGDDDQAIRLASQGIAAAKRMKDDEQEIKGYGLLAQIYRQQGDFEQALRYQVIFSTRREDFARIQRSRQILDLEIQYTIREKQKEIEQLTRENEFQALLLEQSDRIAQQNAQLIQANEELRQFAYVASHDLKEPLRMIGSYTQLIERQFKDQIDDSVAPFFGFVSEGVIRMNNLLDALLRYATIGKMESNRTQVQLTDAVDIAIINLRVLIEETGATIECDTLPAVQSVQSMLVQLFQNLISNAMKFRKPEVQPVVHISATESETEYTIRVKDNGIGINPEFCDRIFVIFQRLHTRDQYEGTGIGLSICQKIVQRLGGQIWVESQLGEGATFCFTLPK